MRVSRLSYYPWGPRLDNANRHSLWRCCQLHIPHLHCYRFPLPLTSHAYHARKLLPPLLPTPFYYRAFEYASAFASHKHMHTLYKEISDENKWSNVKPTLRTDSRKIFKTFNVGDYVMDWIYPKQFPSGTVKMLHVRSARPFKILNKLNCNTYVINLLRNYGISCTFNVNDLVIYKGFDCNTLVVS